MTVAPTLKQEATVTEQAPFTENISRIGPGSHLKTAREAKRMSIEEIANRLRLTKNMVLDIEADKYDNGPAFTFIKGYLRSYARLVSVSPDVVLKAFDQLNLRERRFEVVLPKVPMTTWGVEESYVRWATYGVAALLAVVVIGFSAWWLIQPRPSTEPVSQDLVKLLNNVDGEKQRTTLVSAPPSEVASAKISAEANETSVEAVSAASNASTDTASAAFLGPEKPVAENEEAATKAPVSIPASNKPVKTASTIASSGSSASSGATSSSTSGSSSHSLNSLGSHSAPFIMPEMSEWKKGEE